ncbi:MAG: OstA-like protein [Luteibaculum sp.]
MWSKKGFCFLLFVAASFLALGQKKTEKKQDPLSDTSKTYIEIVFAERAKAGTGADTGAQRLIGSVQLKHNDVLMYCDSAYFYGRSNSIKAFSNVRLIQGDTLHLFGDRINYSGETKIAEVIGNVRLEDPETYLECNHLFYYRLDNVGSYYTGGKMYSKDSPDTLTSEQAVYYSDSKLAIFKKDVVLKNPEYIMETDTMHYSTEIKQSYFFGPTVITSDTNRIFCNAGWYNTESNQSSFYNRAKITGKEQELEGDSLYYDRNTGMGKAFGNVVLTDTINDIRVEGARAFSYNEGDSAIIPEKPLLYYFIGEDTLLLSSDTVYTIKETDSTKTVYAFHDVLFHKSDIQGICDTLIFKENMDRLDMIHSPILWSDSSQVTGDTISIFLKNEVIDRLFIPNNAFIGQQVDSAIYNQIKGKRLTGYFVDQSMDRVEIRGNGESVYFATEDDLDSLGAPIKILVGVNKAICSDMDVKLSGNSIDNIVFITSPASTLHPPYKALDPQFTLRDFEWKEELRPVDKKMVRARGTRIVKFKDVIKSPEVD